LNDPWCNGSTPVFGIVSQGSSPCGSTTTERNSFKIRELRFFILFFAQSLHDSCIFL
jgi:hypothetical protein